MIVGIIQHRNGNTRLPAKVMKEVNGKPLVEIQLERILQSERLDKVVIATTHNKEDDVFVEIGAKYDIDVFRGSENDLVKRLYECALYSGADLVIRICGDNPLIEAKEIDRLINHHSTDFTSNAGDYGNYPDGLGAEAYNLETLSHMNMLVDSIKHREHPHKCIYENEEMFVFETMGCPEEYKEFNELKLDVNTIEDFNYIKSILEEYGNDAHFLDYAESLCSGKK